MRNTCSRRGGEQVEVGLVDGRDRPQVEVDVLTPGAAEWGGYRPAAPHKPAIDLPRMGLSHTRHIPAADLEADADVPDHHNFIFEVPPRPRTVAGAFSIALTCSDRPAD